MYKTLIVDDWEIFLTELEKINVWNEISGFQITARAANGKQALELLRKGSFDLVITDIKMPIIDGLQLLREIRKEDLHLCVILCSEYSDFNYARQGIVYGAFDYLIKPVDEKNLLSLLKRARQHLDELHGKVSPAQPSEYNEDEKWAYPVSAEKQLLHYFGSKDPSLVSFFQSTLEDLYEAMKGNLIKADLIVRKLYHNIIEGVFKEYPWLHNYIDIHYFEEFDYFHEGNENSLKSFYSRKINYLINFIIKYETSACDHTLREIISYILNHPESDLKLKVVASRFFINNTYLSNTFFSKTGIHFNDYVTFIKMSRAEYLFKNSDMKTYEIVYKLGYKDINYFTKQFKKIYGLTPTEYRNAEFNDYQI